MCLLCTTNGQFEAERRTKSNLVTIDKDELAQLRSDLDTFRQLVEMYRSTSSISQQDVEIVKLRHDNATLQMLVDAFERDGGPRTSSSSCAMN